MGLKWDLEKIGKDFKKQQKKEKRRSMLKDIELSILAKVKTFCEHRLGNYNYPDKKDLNNFFSSWENENKR